MLTTDQLLMLLCAINPVCFSCNGCTINSLDDDDEMMTITTLALLLKFVVQLTADNQTISAVPKSSQF